MTERRKSQRRKRPTPYAKDRRKQMIDRNILLKYAIQDLQQRAFAQGKPIGGKRDELPDRG